MTDEIPRRCRIDLMVPAELAILAAVDAVEAMPADVRLTDAVILLARAKDAVADFIDGVPRRVEPEDPLAALRAAKYLNPVCAADGCQTLVLQRRTPA